MAHDFYVLYDKRTLEPYGIGGSPSWENIGDDLLIVKATARDGEDFIQGKKRLNDYIVTVINGYAEFIPKDSDLRFKRKNPTGNTVRDLNYKVVFFSWLDISYETADSVLTLIFDFDKLDVAFQTNFLHLVNQQNSMCDLYITEHNDPTILTMTTEFDLYKLYEQKTIKFNINTNKQISVWAQRK